MDRTDKVQPARAEQEARGQDVLVAKPLPKRRVLNTCQSPSNCH